MSVGELARQVYVDLVRRRSTVRIVPAAEQPTESDGIFLLGLYRSGTTLLRYVVDSHPLVACPPESDFVPSLAAVLSDERSLRGLAAMGFDERHVEGRLSASAAYFFGNYARSCGKPMWADKSPAYVEHLTLLERLFPHARFVCLHRHPLDQVHSHTKGGTVWHDPVSIARQGDEDARVAAARYWSDNTSLLLGRRSSPAFLTLRYEDLCADPTVASRAITDHLGVSWSAEMLDFGAHVHDFGAEATRTRSSSGFEPSSGAWREWPARMIDEVWSVVAEPAAALGYDRAGVPS